MRDPAQHYIQVFISLSWCHHTLSPHKESLIGTSLFHYEASHYTTLNLSQLILSEAGPYTLRINLCLEGAVSLPPRHWFPSYLRELFFFLVEQVKPRIRYFYSFFVLEGVVSLPSRRSKTGPTHSLSCGFPHTPLVRGSHPDASYQSTYLHIQTLEILEQVLHKGQSIFIAPQYSGPNGSKPPSLEEGSTSKVPLSPCFELVPWRDVGILPHL